MFAICFGVNLCYYIIIKNQTKLKWVKWSSKRFPHLITAPPLALVSTDAPVYSCTELYKWEETGKQDYSSSTR